MRSFFKYAAVAVLSAGLVLAVGAKVSQADQEVRSLQKIEKWAQFVKQIYKACGDQEATVVIATLQLKEMGEEGKVDGVAELDRVMAELDHIADPAVRQNLRNFVALNRADLLKKKDRPEAQAATLLSIVEENCRAGQPHGGEPEAAPDDR